MVRGGVPESDFAAVDVHVEPEHGAVEHPLPVLDPGRRERFIPATGEPVSLQAGVEPVSGWVEEPVLAHPEAGVEIALEASVDPPGGSGRDLQHEVRGLAFLPEQVGAAPALRHSEHHEHVRGHPRAGISFDVVEQPISLDRDVRAVPEVHVEGARRVDEGVPLKTGLRERQTVRLGVVDFRRWDVVGAGAGSGRNGCLRSWPWPPMPSRRIVRVSPLLALDSSPRERGTPPQLPASTEHPPRWPRVGPSGRLRERSGRSVTGTNRNTNRTGPGPSAGAGRRGGSGRGFALQLRDAGPGFLQGRVRSPSGQARSPPG